MRRLALYAAGLLALGLLLGSILEAQTPGSVVIRGEFLNTNGCLAFLNSPRLLERGECNFGFVATGVKLQNFFCAAQVSDQAPTSGVQDTIINCTYTKAVLNNSYNPTPALQAGETELPITYAETNGKCLSDLNIPVLQCGFNIVLVGVAIPQLHLTMRRRGGNTWLLGWYAPMRLTLPPPPVTQ